MKQIWYYVGCTRLTFRKFMFLLLLKSLRGFLTGGIKIDCWLYLSMAGAGFTFVALSLSNTGLIIFLLLWLLPLSGDLPK